MNPMQKNKIESEEKEEGQGVVNFNLILGVRLE